MVRYRRNFIAGGTYFFPVTLADRTSSALVDHVSALRMAFRIARHERPFTVDAIVILPEHLHAIWTLPPGDSDFSARWRQIKAHVSIALLPQAHRSNAIAMATMRCGNGAFGNTPFGMRNQGRNKRSALRPLDFRGFHMVLWGGMMRCAFHFSGAGNAVDQVRH